MTTLACDMWLRTVHGLLQVLHPVSEMLQLVSLMAPNPGQRPHSALPAMQLIEEVNVPAATGSITGGRRLHLELQLPAAGAIGVMNVSGPVLDWSFAHGALEVRHRQQLAAAAASGCMFCVPVSSRVGCICVGNTFTSYPHLFYISDCENVEMCTQSSIWHV